MKKAKNDIAANNGQHVEKTKEYLRYNFTDAEYLDHARKLGRLNEELARAEERKKSVSAELASMVKTLEDQVSAQSRLVSNGYEYRDIDCEVRFDDPERGKKRVVRLDTGEVVREAFMTGNELQETLPLTETQA